MSGTVQGFVAALISQLGTPYVFGGDRPGGFDCSGLVFWGAGTQGVSIARTSEEQWATLERIEAPEYGCVIFFDVPTDIQPQPAHEGVWLNPQSMVEAPHTGLDVRITSIPNNPGESIMGYGRIPFPVAPPEPPKPPKPQPSEEEKMVITFANGKYLCGGVSPQGHPLVFVAENPAGPWSVCDLTDDIHAQDPNIPEYTVTA